MNGVLRSMLEATGDSSRFSGTAGEETNPWAIEDTYDFMNMDSKNNGLQEVCFMLKNNIDFNDHEQYKLGWSNTSADKKLYCDYTRFDGDGKQIRNLVIKGINFDISNSERWKLKNLYNTHFVNLVDLDCKKGGSKWLVVSGECKNNSFNIMHFSQTHLWNVIPTKSIGCSYNLAYNSSDDINLGNSNLANLVFERCWINLDNCSSNAYSVLRSVEFTNCCVTGSFTPLKTGIDFAYYGRAASSMFAVKVNTESVIKMPSSDWFTTTGVNIFDKEIAHIDKASTATAKYLTTAEMKDTSILQGYGFPVVRG